MRFADFLAHLPRLGARPEHAQRLLRAWLAGLSLSAGPRRQPAERVLPQRLYRALPELSAALAGLARPVAEHAGRDGSVRRLLELADGQTVESVLLPRDGVCVSTQVGCAVGCTFCMTGQEGLLRQLDCGEILAQVVLARQRRPIRRVVFMGMGEPAHNLDTVLEAIRLLGTLGGFGHKELVFSSVGDRRIFARLPLAPVRPALALSLHSTRPEVRARLLPRIAAMPPDELVAAGEDYARAVGHPIQYQWTLLAGINDDEAEIAGLERLLRGKYAKHNLNP